MNWASLKNQAVSVVDRLVWGLLDLRRSLMERGWWPCALRVATSPEGRHWTIAGARVQPGIDGRRAEGLLVPESECLWGHLTLPGISRAQLGDAVQEAMWRVAPLPPQQLVMAWRAEPAGLHAWQVLWGACRRDAVADWAARQHLPPTAPVYLAWQKDALAAAGPGQQATRGQQRALDAMALGVSAMVVFAVLTLALMPLILKRQAVVRAMRHVTVMEQQTGALRQQLDTLRAQAAVAEQLRATASASLPLAATLDRLAQSLPQDTWLDRLDINGDEVRIAGLTDNATDLLAALGKNPAWGAPRATAPSVRDEGQGKERFTFEMRWRAATTQESGS
ncbi:MAG: PilN domain-containing protein [Burkholderiaceae bacterium]|jgi:general secretion pathway protein L|nr:PilN domain-containing protein [Burkholderiaceae bacterium]